MPKKFETDRPTIDEIIKRKKPRTRSIWLPLDSDLVAEIERLDKQLAIEERLDQREHRPPVAPRIRAELEALRAERDDAAVEFIFTALAKKDFRRLKDEHADPDGQKAWNEETFAPALIAACASSPTISLEQAQTICDEWEESTYTQLFHAALMVNAEESKVPFSVRSTGPTTGSESSSTTAANTD